MDNAHLKEDLKSLEDDMKTLSADNQELRNMLDNYRRDMNKSGMRDPFGNESPLPSPVRPLNTSSPVLSRKNPCAACHHRSHALCTIASSTGAFFV